MDFFSRLKYVSLANIYSLTDQTMRALAGYTSELTALDITGCWRITDQGMNLVTEYCPKLQVLNVTDCRYDIFFPNEWMQLFILSKILSRNSPLNKSSIKVLT